MTIDELNRALAIVGGDTETDTIRACRLSITDDLTLHEASRRVAISHPTVYRKMAQLRAALARPVPPVCEACGQPINTRI